jgi:MOSC domain-containing protein YiiM
MLASLEAGLEQVRNAPKDRGVLELIVRRPAVDEREVLGEATLDESIGLVGDTWPDRASTSSPDGGPHPLRQITLMSARAAALLAGERERWALAGDQLYVDLDITYDNIPPGTRLAIGDAVIEVTEPPHRGCKKFASRFGVDALRLVNSDVGVSLNLRGVNARVVTGGTVRAGDAITKV